MSYKKSSLFILFLVVAQAAVVPVFAMENAKKVVETAKETAKNVVKEGVEQAKEEIKKEVTNKVVEEVKNQVENEVVQNASRSVFGYSNGAFTFDAVGFYEWIQNNPLKTVVGSLTAAGIFVTFYSKYRTYCEFYADQASKLFNYMQKDLREKKASSESTVDELANAIKLDVKARKYIGDFYTQLKAKEYEMADRELKDLQKYLLHNSYYVI